LRSRAISEREVPGDDRLKGEVEKVCWQSVVLCERCGVVDRSEPTEQLELDGILIGS
jgi:hypothetical protein